MACRIGITTDPQERKRFWQRQHRFVRNWQIISTHRTKTAAQRQERALAARYGCVSHPGGAGPERATWYVYYFEY